MTILIPLWAPFCLQPVQQWSLITAKQDFPCLGDLSCQSWRSLPSCLREFSGWGGAGGGGGERREGEAPQPAGVAGMLLLFLHLAAASCRTHCDA